MNTAQRLSHTITLFSLIILLNGCAMPQQRSDTVNDYPPQPFLANMGYCKNCYTNNALEPFANTMPSFTLESVYFQSNSATLRATAKAKIDSIITAIQFKRPQTILIEGHADSRASARYNQGLSERRANTVREALITGGIEAARIISRGYGEQRPVANNRDSNGRQRNRRVEIYLQ